MRGVLDSVWFFYQNQPWAPKVYSPKFYSLHKEKFFNTNIDLILILVNSKLLRFWNFKFQSNFKESIRLNLTNKTTRYV